MLVQVYCCGGVIILKFIDEHDSSTIVLACLVVHGLHGLQLCWLVCLSTMIAS